MTEHGGREFDVTRVAAALAARARDATYVAVGLGVLGLQRAQARRRDLERRVEHIEGLEQVGAGVSAGAKALGEWLEGTVAFVSSQLEPLEAQLPDPAREAAARARHQLRTWRQLLEAAAGI